MKNALKAFSLSFAGTAGLLAVVALGFSLAAPGPRVAQAQAGSASWIANHAPAANTVATASVAGVTNHAHVANCLVANLVAGAVAPAAATATFVVRDGATGAGTILFQYPMAISAAAGTYGNTLYNCGFQIVGTAGNAMTVEFTGAAGANTLESVFATGYDR